MLHLFLPTNLRSCCSRPFSQALQRSYCSKPFCRCLVWILFVRKYSIIKPGQITSAEITVPPSLAESSMKVAVPGSFSWMRSHIRNKKPRVETATDPVLQRSDCSRLSFSQWPRLRPKCPVTRRRWIQSWIVILVQLRAEKYWEAVCCWSGKYFPWTKCPAWTEENK